MNKQEDRGKAHEIRTLADLTPDEKNARVHNERNIAMLERSLEQYGAARSIVIDEQGKILAGHGVVEAAANVGIHKVVPVEASGNEIVAVVRRGLTEKQKAELALADNRTAELAEWSPEILKALSAEADLKKFWTEKELTMLIGLAPGDFPEVDENIPVEHVCPKCGYRFSGGEIIRGGKS
jgi:ParB-like chromosome segregation protein Spo0J